MPKPTRKQYLGWIHQSAAKVFPDDDAYRNFLQGHFGVRSCKDLTVERLREVDQKLKGLLGVDGTNRPTQKQWAMMKAQAIKMGWKNTRAPEFVSFVKRTAKVDNPRFMSRSNASDVIAGLDNWIAQKGQQ